MVSAWKPHQHSRASKVTNGHKESFKWLQHWRNYKQIPGINDKILREFTRHIRVTKKYKPRLLVVPKHFRAAKVLSWVPAARFPPVWNSEKDAQENEVNLTKYTKWWKWWKLAFSLWKGGIKKNSRSRNHETRKLDTTGNFQTANEVCQVATGQLPWHTAPDSDGSDSSSRDRWSSAKQWYTSAEWTPERERMWHYVTFWPNFRSKPLSRLSISHLQNVPPLSRLYHLPQVQSFLKVGSIRNLHHSVTKDWSSFQSNSPKISPKCWRRRGTLSRRHSLRSPPPPIQWGRRLRENVNFGSTKTLKNI